MQIRQLGPGGPEVSAIGVGAMSFAGFYGPTTEAEAHELLATAEELGIDHLDTSNVYGMGRSESIIGDYHARTGRRPFRIATKAGIRRDPETRARSFDNSREHLEAELDGSLKRLQVEAVDLFYVHRRQAELPIEEVAESLASFVRSGKAHAIGFSEIAPSSLRRAAAVHPVAAVQSEYSIATRAPELGLVQACDELGAALVAFSPVARGLLTDVPPDRARSEASDFLSNNPRFVEPNLSANRRLTDRFRELARDMGVAAASLAIAWLLHRSDRVIPIPGTRWPAHLRELAAGADLDLSAEDVARIETVLPVGWAHGDRYTAAQWVGPEYFC